MLAGIETGGTKVICAIAPSDAPQEISDSRRIDTRDPDSTFEEISSFLRSHHVRTPIGAVGVASFGPLDTDPASATYGWITTTPKPGWAMADLHHAVRTLGDLPTGFVTDVSGSLLGERAGGSLTGLDDAAYITVGTGIGAGIMVAGQLVTGRATPELGHILVRRHPRDTFQGNCPYHGDCLEGLASGPAVKDRWGRPAAGEELETIAYYIAQACLTLILTAAPSRIVIGGGVAKTPGLMDVVEEQLARLLGGYLGADHPASRPGSGYIEPPGLGDFSGAQGALVLAQTLLAERSGQSSAGR